MGKDAISDSKSKEHNPTKDSSSGYASPLILILAIFAVIVLCLFFFKDKIFRKKSKNLDELVKKQKEEKPEPTPEPKQETVTEEKAEQISDKFAKKD